MRFSRLLPALPLLVVASAVPLHAQSCHPSYELVCVPAGVSDVDCAGDGLACET